MMIQATIKDIKINKSGVTMVLEEVQVSKQLLNDLSDSIGYPITLDVEISGIIDYKEAE